MSFNFVGQYSKSRVYAKLHDTFVNTVMDVFYNSTIGVWFDYDIHEQRQNVNFYPSSFVPLYSGCFKFSQKTDVEKLLNYLGVKKASLKEERNEKR